MPTQKDEGAYIRNLATVCNNCSGNNPHLQTQIHLCKDVEKDRTPSQCTFSKPESPE